MMVSQVRLVRVSVLCICIFSGCAVFLAALCLAVAAWRLSIPPAKPQTVLCVRIDGGHTCRLMTEPGSTLEF